MQTSTLSIEISAHDTSAYDMSDLLAALPANGFVRQAVVLRFVPFSKSTLWRRIGKGEFPSPVKLSVGITAWRAEDVHRWIDEQASPKLP